MVEKAKGAEVYDDLVKYLLMVGGARACVGLGFSWSGQCMVPVLCYRTPRMSSEHACVGTKLLLNTFKHPCSKPLL